jgi:hypothetical protein
VIWLIGFAFPGFDRALYWHHHGAHFSEARAATWVEQDSDTQNATCNTLDTNGWDYACSYTSPDGTVLQVGVQKNGLMSGTVPLGNPLPPR